MSAMHHEAEQGAMQRVDYDCISAVYDERYDVRGPPGIAEALSQLAGQVAARRVLEVGCGTGHWLSSLPGAGLRCGLDLSAGMLTQAHRQDRSLALVRGTAGYLPFGAQEFDLVFCIYALHHFDERIAFIRAALRALRPGGALAIVGSDPQTEDDQWYLYDYFPGTRERDLARYPAGATILSWMGEAGFVRCARRLLSRIEHVFTGREVLEDLFLRKDSTSQLLLLSDEEYNAGLARIRAALRRADSEGKVIRFRIDIAVPIVVGFAPDRQEASAAPGRPP